MNDLIKISSIGNSKSPHYLLKAWLELYKNTNKKSRDRTHGIDGQTVNDFLDNYDIYLKTLSNNIRSDSGYMFSPLKPVLIPKKDSGKYRVICIPTVKDRIVQKSIQLLLFDKNNKYTKFNSINHGFVPGKGVQSAITKAIKERNNNPYVLKTDIVKFFDNIKRSALKEQIEKKIRSKSLHSILNRAIDSEILYTDKRIKSKIEQQGIVDGIGVRQGMPISPFISNLYLYDFDYFLLKNHIRAVRYADDLLVFGNTKKECEALFENCRKQFEKIGLEVPDLGKDSKSQIFLPKDEVDFLGMCIKSRDGFNEAIISESQKQIIRSNFYNLSNLDYLASKEITIKNYVNRLRSMIAGYSAVYSECDNYDEIRDAMEKWARNSLQKLFKDEFGINYRDLSTKRKRFLDIT